MRKTLGGTKEALEFMTKIDEMDEDARNHFRMVLLKLIDCYTRDDTFGVLLISRADKPYNLVGINCDEMDSAALLQEACGVMMDYHTEDMPDKGMLN